MTLSTFINGQTGSLTGFDFSLANKTAVRPKIEQAISLDKVAVMKTNSLATKTHKKRDFCYHGVFLAFMTFGVGTLPTLAFTPSYISPSIAASLIVGTVGTMFSFLYAAKSLTKKGVELVVAEDKIIRSMSKKMDLLDLCPSMDDLHSAKEDCRNNLTKMRAARLSALPDAIKEKMEKGETLTETERQTRHDVSQSFHKQERAKIAAENVEMREALGLHVHISREFFLNKIGLPEPAFQDARELMKMGRRLRSYNKYLAALTK